MMTTITISSKHINLCGQSKLEADSELIFGFVYKQVFDRMVKQAGSCKRDYCMVYKNMRSLHHMTLLVIQLYIWCAYSACFGTL